MLMIYVVIMYVTGMDDFVVSVSGEGLLMTRNVPREVAEKVVVAVLTQREQTSVGMVAKTEEPPQEEISLWSYAKNYQAERTVDKILLIGVYLAKVQGLGLFERKDVVAGLEQLAEPIPKNLSRDMAWAVRIGWIARKVGVRGVYYVTELGYMVVEGNFPKEEVGKTPLAAVRKKAR